MDDKTFLVQIKRTNGVYEKGVVVKDSLDAARQSFRAYLGAYGYGKDANTDYVAVYIVDMRGARLDWKVDDRRLVPVEEETADE